MTKRKPAFTCTLLPRNTRGDRMKRVGMIENKKAPASGNASGKENKGTQTGSVTAGAPASGNASGK